MFILFLFREVGFHSFCQFTPCEHDPPPAAHAFHADIRAEARDDPLVGTARVLFAEAQAVAEVKIGKHG